MGTAKLLGWGAVAPSVIAVDVGSGAAASSSPVWQCSHAFSGWDLYSSMIPSISLAAGTWVLFGEAGSAGTAGGAISDLSLSATAGSSTSDWTATKGGNGGASQVPRWITAVAVIATTTTVYLSANCGGNTYYSNLYAVRIA